MTDKRKGILIISPTLSPNVGGVETHLDDLIKFLKTQAYEVFVLSYSPITTPGVSWLPREDSENIHIRRFAWFGQTLLHRIEKKPLLDFLYITPYLLVRSFIFMFFNHRKIDCIHAQGLNAAFIGGFLKKVFKKRLIVSTHALYDIPAQSSTAMRIRKILNKANLILALSTVSFHELASFGIEKSNLRVYRYWIDSNAFQVLSVDTKVLRQQLGLPNRFTVLFVGRLTEIKGVKELVEVAHKLPKINFVFIGTGPLADYLKEEQKKMANIRFLGRIDNQKLGVYYNASDLLCIPSQYKEGFGRVVMEALACGLPVVGSNKGGIPEALDHSVSVLVNPTVDNMTEAILHLYQDRVCYKQLKDNCRGYALQNFNKDNAKVIIKAYEGES